MYLTVIATHATYANNRQYLVFSEQLKTELSNQLVTGGVPWMRKSCVFLISLIPDVQCIVARAKNSRFLCPVTALECHFCRVVQYCFTLWIRYMSHYLLPNACGVLGVVPITRYTRKLSHYVLEQDSPLPFPPGRTDGEDKCSTLPCPQQAVSHNHVGRSQYAFEWKVFLINAICRILMKSTRKKLISVGCVST